MTPGTVLYLSRRLETSTTTLRPGCYVLLHVEDATALLCLAGEDEAGDVCTTEKLFTVNVYDVNTVFRPLGMILPMER